MKCVTWGLDSSLGGHVGVHGGGVLAPRVRKTIFSSLYSLCPFVKKKNQLTLPDVVDHIP